MDQKKLFAAIIVSIAILLGWQLVVARYLPQPPPAPAPSEQAVPAQGTSPGTSTGTSRGTAPAAGAALAAPVPPPAALANAPRLRIAAPAVRGSMSLLGARLDDLVLNDYRKTIAPDSPNVPLLQKLSGPTPYYVQFGWSAPEGEVVKLPDDKTLWSASAPELTVGRPVTLSWANGQGLTFRIQLSIDAHYMFSIEQQVVNATGQAVKLSPWQRIRRDYRPQTSGYYLIFEGLLGVDQGRLQNYTYAAAEKDAKDKPDDAAYRATAAGGWAGISDQYWLTALVPDQSVPTTVRYRYIAGGAGHFQVDYVTASPLAVAPGATLSTPERLFAGAKVVDLVDHYASEYQIPQFDKAIDWGWFPFLTKPVFFCLDFLNGLLGNFGLAIILLTCGVKLLFFPLANYSYRSMSKMRLLSPKIQAVRERFKDDPQKQQQEMMALYKAEKVNPASGCLPMIVQIPVFFALYKNLYVTIEMRHAPFFGWIHDLSAVDPTNVFTLFGLIPWDPTATTIWPLSMAAPFLHVGALPLIMGFSMWLQQRLNPPPPDPTQARLFQLMPVIFTFMLARFPAGLVLYWTCNNLLSVAQQWVILRRTRLSRPGLARTT